MSIEVTWLQAGDYSAREDRLVIAAAVPTEQVIDPAGGGLLVTQRAAGTDMSVDVAAGIAVIEGDDQADQGNYVARNTAAANVAGITAPGSNSWIVIVYLQVRDPDAGGSAGDDAALGFVTGTAAASPVAPTLPDSAIELARITIPTGTVAITNAMISDRRFLPSTPLGDGAARAKVLSEEATTSTSYVALATACAVTVTIGSSGKCLLINSAWMRASAGFNLDLYLAAEYTGANVGGLGDDEALVYDGTSATDKVGASRVALLTGLNPGSTTFTQKAKVTAGATGQFARRELCAIPL